MVKLMWMYAVVLRVFVFVCESMLECLCMAYYMYDGKKRYKPNIFLTHIGCLIRPFFRYLSFAGVIKNRIQTNVNPLRTKTEWAWRKWTDFFQRREIHLPKDTMTTLWERVDTCCYVMKSYPFSINFYIITSSRRVLFVRFFPITFFSPCDAIFFLSLPLAFDAVIFICVMLYPRIIIAMREKNTHDAKREATEYAYTL